MLASNSEICQRNGVLRFIEQIRTLESQFATDFEGRKTPPLSIPGVSKNMAMNFLCKCHKKCNF